MALPHYILDELTRVLPRLSRIRMTQTEIRDLTDSLMFQADIVESAESTDKALRDAADQPILQTLAAAQAQYLITGDLDLLALSDRYPIVSPKEFWTRHGA